jgi:hypothetical protein
VDFPNSSSTENGNAQHLLETPVYLEVNRLPSPNTRRCADVKGIGGVSNSSCTAFRSD